MFTKTHAKYIQSLHHKKFRDEFGVFFAEGPRAVGDLLQAANLHCTLLIATADWLLAHANLIKKIPEVLEVQPHELQKASALQQAHQVLAVFNKKTTDADIPAATGNLTLLLDGLQDPGNMGTIIRTADWFGVQQIVCTPDCADQYNPKVVQGTMGSLARIQLYYSDAAEWLQNRGEVNVYATMLDGIPLQKVAPFKSGIIILGNEGRGISAELLQLANKKITIPRRGGAESLNAGVAMGIVLAHITV